MQWSTGGARPAARTAGAAMMSRWSLSGLYLLVVAILGVIAARRRYAVITVTGTSMAPSLLPGDRLLIRRGAADLVRVGTVIVLRPPKPVVLMHSPPSPDQADPPPLTLVKRVAAVPGDAVPEPVRPAAGGARIVPDGMFVVLSDDPGGMDSRLWGFVPAAKILGSALCSLPASGDPASTMAGKPTLCGNLTRRG